MKNIIIWGDEDNFLYSINEIRHFESIKDINVLGVCLRGDHKDLCGYDHIPPKSPQWQLADCILICVHKFTKEDIAQIKALGFERDDIVLSAMLKRDGFSFERYLDLAKNKLTIISNCCWGGLTYNHFRLQFLSPTINLFFTDDEYIHFLNNFDKMMLAEPRLCGTGYNEAEDLVYPIFDLNGVKLYMNHCRDHEEGLRQWKERRARINRDNMLVMMATNYPYFAYLFEKTPFKNKLSFVPANVNNDSLPSSVLVNNGNIPIVEYVNSFATGGRSLYDPWSLLETFKIKYADDYIAPDVEKTQYKINQKLEDAKKILVYGAWVLGKMAGAQVSVYLPDKMMGFAVTSMDNNPQTLLDHPVRSISEWTVYMQQQGISKKDVTVILALHPQYYDEVTELLSSQGFSEILSFEDLEWFAYNAEKNSGT